MSILSQLAAGALVSLLNFAIHALITGIIVVVTRHTARVTDDMHVFIRIFSLLTVTMITLMIAHAVEISVWATYYTLSGLEVKNAVPFEFAFENYTALGYGDAVPAERWRLTGPITALNGLLLIGWSVAIILEVLRMAELSFGRGPKRGRRGN